MPTLKELRTQKLMSMEDLAEKSGLNRRTIERLELGTSIPRFVTLRKLSQGLGVDASLIEFGQQQTSIENFSSVDVVENSEKLQYEETIKQLNGKIDTLARILASEMEHARFWAGTAQLNDTSFSEILARLLSTVEQIGHLSPKWRTDLLSQSELITKKFRDCFWPGIPMSGEPDFKNVNNLKKWREYKKDPDGTIRLPLPPGPEDRGK